MPKLCVPNIGTKLELAEEWEFMLYNVWDNHSFTNLMAIEFEARDPLGNYYPAHEQCCPVTIPKGIVLTVASALLKKGRQDDNGITFNIPKLQAEKLLNPYGGVREGMINLYVKLEDVNKLVFV